MSLNTTSMHLLRTSIDGDWSTSLGILFQCLIILLVQTFLLISNLILHLHNLRRFLLVLLLITTEKRLTPVSLQPPFRYLYRGGFPLPPFSSDYTTPLPSSTPHKTCSPDSSPVSLPFSGHTPTSYCPSCIEGPKTEPLTQKCGLTSAEYCRTNTL